MTTQTVSSKAFTADHITALFAPPLERPTATEQFEIQRARLADAKLAPIEMFDRFASQLTVVDRPFLLLPPQPGELKTLDWADLMARITLNGKTGQNYLDVSALSDLDPIVTTPRMLRVVEDGRQRLNTKLSVAQADITAASRFGYGLWHGYIHAVAFTEVLNHHYMDLLRSRYNSDLVPCLCLHGERPALNAYWSDLANAKWGAPSFGSEVGD